MSGSENPGRRPFLRRLTVLPWPTALASCGTSGLPPLVLVRLPLEARAEARAVARSGTSALPGDAVIELPGTRRLLPGHLDRDAVVVAQGAGALMPLAGLRWAEPLRDAVPRLLRADLSRTLGRPVTAADAPHDGTPVLRLELEIAALDLGAEARTLQVRAAWQWRMRVGRGAPGGRTPRTPQSAEAAWTDPVHRAAGDSLADAVSIAHRAAIAELARHVAASVA